MSSLGLPPTVLVIGYGNLLRGDDGVGQRVATVVAEWQLPNVRSRSVHQLMPELAQELSEVNLALFVDAGLTINQVTLAPLEPSLDPQLPWGHSLSPQTLLGLSQWLYHCAPQGWMITIPGVNFSHSDHLSAMAAQGMTVALRQIAQFLSSHG